MDYSNCQVTILLSTAYIKFPNSFPYNIFKYADEVIVKFQCGFVRIDQRQKTYSAFVRYSRIKLKMVGKCRVEEILRFD
jgi:hypothetical protein